MVTLANSSERCQSFHKLTSAECRHMYKTGIYNAQTYILNLVKCSRAAGWKWTFTVRDFCREWEIPVRTFYAAIKKLSYLGELHWEVKGAITVWYGADIANQDKNNTSENLVQVLAQPLKKDTDTSENLVQVLAQPMQEPAQSVQESAHIVQEPAHEISTTLAVKGLKNSPDYIQTSTESSDSVEEESLGAFAPQDSAIEKPILKVKKEVAEKDVPERPLVASTIDPDLETHLEAAVQGKEPSEDIKQQLLNHPGYAPTYRVYAKRYGWRGDTFASTMPDSASEILNKLRERGKYKVPK
ncbi:MAG: hypothetical protein ICV78_00220 [Tolypothrix sp. Co-bin9]|nr:hypothetical protein [Tolypothrix sp. Co-bin9]